MPDDTDPQYFRLFNEIGILAQLSRALLEKRLPKGLLISHFSVLNHLVRVQDGRTPFELAQAFQVAKTTMTHTLSGIAAQGYIDMRPNPEDARSKRIWITDKGRELRNRTVEALAEDIAGLKAEFSAERVDQLLPELESLRRIMDSNRR